MTRSIPEFAVVGHPNEGKSSVLSTLAEDDSVRISPMPGETKECQSFPVSIDGREIIRFVDTPGFQNPRKSLQWMQQYQGSDEALIKDFKSSTIIFSTSPSTIKATFTMVNHHQIDLTSTSCQYPLFYNCNLEMFF